MYEKIVLNIKI